MSRGVRPATGSQAAALSADDFVDALRGTDTLEMLGFTNDDLQLARSDSDLLETLRIGHEILAALRDSDVLDTFLRLPKADQTNFLRWTASTDGHDARHERTATLIAALEESPLADPPPARG